MPNPWGNAFGLSGTPVFVSQMSFVSEVQQRTLYVKPKREASEASDSNPSAQVEKGSKNLFLKAEINQQTVFTEPNQVWITDHQQQSTTFTKPHNVFTIRRKTVN